MVLSLAVLLGFTYILLRAFKLEARFLQTLSAMAGVSLLFNLASWPLLYVVSTEVSNAPSQTLVSLLFLMLISWEILVKAHIFKHALELIDVQSHGFILLTVFYNHDLIAIIVSI